ncbi:unnamed protein product [Heligmosomoides polygyrus]|uniref:C2 domain-containing protein n=1 Tax=Heligmosomoides polygyrus TaxID=6339 RepID=A0A3P8CG23_HELPZ|nr:unnamed protein product [Heligmosomoides polygyrus]
MCFLYSGFCSIVSSQGRWQECGRTECLRNTLNPEWAAQIRVEYFFEEKQTMRFEIYDIDSESKELSAHDFLGSIECELAEIVSNRPFTKPLTLVIGPKRYSGEIIIWSEEVDEGSKENALFHWSLINEKKRAKKGDKYKNSGTLEFNGAQILKQHTFLDFIGGGTQLDFAVAVDFTASNGAVHKPTSLHCINPTVPNQYEIATRAVIDICQHYNNSKLFDAFGFGAILPPQTCVSPIFSLVGIVRTFSLFAPTHVSVLCRISMRIRLLLGCPASTARPTLPRDMAATKAAIIAASALPLSIIIVGVGNDEFENMNELDSDDRMLSHAGRTAERDIVQFVPLRNFLNQGITGAESERVMGLLAKEVLAEVPLQLTSFMKKRHIVPRPPDNPFPKDSEAG